MRRSSLALLTQARGVAPDAHPRKACPMKPLALSDAQMDAILTAARPLSVADRAAFLEEVAAALESAPTIGDGSFHQNHHADPAQILCNRPL